MNKLIVGICLVGLVGVGRPVVAAEKNWSIVVKDSKSTEEVRTNDECVELNINKGKTVLRVCTCGSVEVQEYKEVVKNKDNTFSSQLYYYNNGNGTISAK